LAKAEVEHRRCEGEGALVSVTLRSPECLTSLSHGLSVSMPAVFAVIKRLKNDSYGRLFAVAAS